MFFFSSRRRHTRLQGDWSSDVCSSDLGRERALHRTTEADTVLQLLRDRLRDELRVELGPLDLVDVDVDVLLGDCVQLFAQRVHLDARLADHDAGARRVDVDRDPLLVLADQDVGQSGVRKLVGDVFPDLDVLDQVAGELLLPRVPVGLPVVDDADAHPAGMDFLTHQVVAPFFAGRLEAVFFLLVAARFGFGASVASAVRGSGVGGASTRGASTSVTVMWQVRLRIRATRPRARARQRFMTGPPSTYVALTYSRSSAMPWFASAFETADCSTFCSTPAASRDVKARTARASGTLRPRMCSATSRALRGDIRTYLACARTSLGVSTVLTGASSPRSCGRRNGRGRSGSAR